MNAKEIKMDRLEFLRIKIEGSKKELIKNIENLGKEAAWDLSENEIKNLHNILSAITNKNSQKC